MTRRDLRMIAWVSPKTTRVARQTRVARGSYGKVAAFLAARTRDEAAAEGALPEAFASALSDWPRSGCPANPEAWLLAVARRKSIDASRQRRRRVEVVSGQPQAIREALHATLTDAPIPDQRLAELSQNEGHFLQEKAVNIDSHRMQRLDERTWLPTNRCPKRQAHGRP